MSALPERFPAEMKSVYGFTVCNAFSFQIILGSPMVLYAKSLGASATVLGILAGMMPLLVIFQIPASKHIGRVGYKRFVYAGWGTRVCFIFALALVPLGGVFLDAATRLVLVLVLLFGFNLSRGISSAAWFPWVTSFIPPSIRGLYLARDTAFSNAGSFLVFVLSAFCLGTQPQPWRFAALFVFSAVMGAWSLSFLKRFPEGTPEVRSGESREPVPWRAILRFVPFQRLMLLNIAWSVAYGGLSTFVVAFLKTETGLSERDIMLVSSVSFLGGLGSLWFLGPRLDHLGSKPVITFCLITWISIQILWVLLAGGVLPPSLGALLTLQFLMGLSAALVTMAITRLAMAIIPAAGRSHFFALHSVAGNLTLGLAPVLWGLLIDALGPLHTTWHGLEWNPFSVFFLVVMLAFGVALVLARRLEEPRAASMEGLLVDILRQSPLRIWLRFWRD